LKARNDSNEEREEEARTKKKNEGRIDWTIKKINIGKGVQKDAYGPTREGDVI